MIRNWFSMHKRSIIVLGCSIALLIALIVFDNHTHLITNSVVVFLKEWALPLSGLGTITLAVMALLSILENRRMRTADKDLEFRRRSMDDVVKWVREIRRECLARRSHELGLFEQLIALESVQIDGAWIVDTAGIFGRKFKTNVTKLTKAIESYIVASKGYVGSVDVSSKGMQSLLQSIDDVLKAAVRLKREHKL